MSFWIGKYRDYDILLDGDFNTDLDGRDAISDILNKFIVDHNICRCDKMFPSVSKRNTFVNEARNCGSCIDYLLASSKLVVSNFNVIDPDFNLSDHYPITIKCLCLVDMVGGVDAKTVNDHADVTHLRWDHADLMQYKELSGVYLQNIYSTLAQLESDDNNVIAIDDIYDQIISILLFCPNCTVPAAKKIFFQILVGCRIR